MRVDEMPPKSMAIPVTGRLFHLAKSFFGYMMYKVTDAALIRPHTKPAIGMDRVPRSPFVAMNSVAKSAHTTPKDSVARGSRRANTQATIMVIATLSDCRTVAGPAFVKPMVTM